MWKRKHLTFKMSEDITHILLDSKIKFQCIDTEEEGLLLEITQPLTRGQEKLLREMLFVEEKDGQT